jgi:hypothetical protein
MRGLGSQVGERPALHVYEGVFPGGVHQLQNKRARVGSVQMKIVVVFARQRSDRGGQSV